MPVLIFAEAYRHVRDAVRYCKRNRKPTAQFTFRGRVYAIQRLKIGWILWHGPIQATDCKKKVFKICPCSFFRLSAAIIMVRKYLELQKQSSPSKSC